MSPSSQVTGREGIGPEMLGSLQEEEVGEEGEETEEKEEEEGREGRRRWER